MINLTDLSFSYPGNPSPVLHEINLQIPPGDFNACFGRIRLWEIHPTPLLERAGPAFHRRPDQRISHCLRFGPDCQRPLR